MQTNIDIDDALMEQALRVTQLTQKAVVEEGLKLLLITLNNQTGFRKMFGKIPLENDLDEVVPTDYMVNEPAVRYG